MRDSEDREIEFMANPTQQLFIESRHEADMFSSRKGEGKSAGLVWCPFFHTQHNPGAHWLLIRDTFENLRRTTMQEFFSWFPDGVFGDYIAGEKLWIWNTQRTGLKGKIYFLGADDEAAASKIASMPLAGVGIDEPAPAAGESQGVPEFVFDTAMAQLRQPGMNWYAAKLAQNNPDESHWSYRRFVDPGTPPDDIELLPMQESGFKAWQTRTPENTQNLPPGYYESLAKRWAHRPDLVKRFVEGKYGYQQVGRPVTPSWNDELHIASDLAPVRGVPLWLLYDGGLNPTCIVTQVTPIGHWLILEAFVGDGIGMYQLIENEVAPALASRYEGFTWSHTGDPNLMAREQSNSGQSAARVITKTLGGRFVKGPIDVDERVEPLNAVLSRTIGGRGVVQVDKHKAREVWYALRGGWHWHITRTGVAGNIKKNMHSHPGDSMGYGAAKLFPLGKLPGTKKPSKVPRPASYFGRAPHPGTSMGMARPDVKVPKAMRTLGGK